MTTETFADFVATQDARNQIQLNIRKYTLMLCNALKITSSPVTRVKLVVMMLLSISLGSNVCKYHKIIMEVPNNNRPPSRSVHAFVDKKTGEVYKAASFKAPAKHVRFNLLLIKDRSGCMRMLIGQRVISICVDYD